MIRFMANEDFYCEELKSAYVTGLSYTIRPHNQVLHDFVHDHWLPEGKVTLFDGMYPPGVKVIAGVGTVKDNPVVEKVKETGFFAFIKRSLSWL